MPDQRKTNVPKHLADRYRVDAPIGEGAHASTWRGWDERLERPVAIKMLHQRLANDPVFVQRFQAEAKVAASVRQGNVVDVYDFGQQDGTLYMVMQFVDGEDLKSYIQQAAPIPAKDAKRIIGNVLDGLHAIHAAGIVHRDIKPQNVLLGTDGVARVTDFGVAEVDVTAGLTGEGLTIGTVDYMAPEQAQGLPLTPAADLYATGVVLYEMLTGTLLFQGKNSRETMLQHINGQLVPPSTRMPERGITPAMDAVIAQSLAKDPTRRFGSARAMKQAIGAAFSAGSPAPTQQTSVIPNAPVLAQSHTPAPAYQSPVYVDEDAGAGLNSAFKGLIALLIIGAIGVALWGAVQLLDSDSFDFNLPFGNQQETPSPTATATATVPGDVNAPIEPSEPGQDSDPPVNVEPTNPPAPTEIAPPTEAPVEQPTSPPDDDVVPIEPIEPDGGTVPTEEPVVEPSGYDDGYSIA